MKTVFRLSIALLSATTFPLLGAVTWTLDRHQEGDTLVYVATARNDGSTPEKLGRYKVHAEEVPLSLEAVALLPSGWQGPSLVRKLQGSTAPLTSKTLVQLYDGARAFQAGFITFDRIGTEHEVHWNAEQKTALVTSYCDFRGFELAAGASISTEKLVVRRGSDPYAALEAWANAAASHYRPQLWPEVPAGWVGWSWVDGFNIELYEDVVRRNARAIRERLPGAKIDYIWVSIGNLAERRPGNWLRWNTKLFPSGPEAFIRDLGSLDFKLGLWCGAFWLNTDLANAFDIPTEAVLHRDGKPIVVESSQWGNSFVPDPTHPKVKTYLSDVFRTYRDWGVRYYMIDFLNAIGDAIPGTYLPDGFFDKTLIQGPQTLRAGLQTIREAAGDDTYLLSSTGATFQTVGLVNAARAGSDYGEGRPLDGKGKGFYPGTFVINNPHYWTSHRRATAAWAATYYTHNRLYLSDSGNVMTVDKPLPRPDAEIAATIFGLNGGPVMLGDDIDRMDTERLNLIRQQFPRLPETARPLDLFESPDPSYARTFHLHVKTSWDDWHLLAVFNYDAEPSPTAIDFAKLGLDTALSWVSWDHWAGRYQPIKANPLSVSVAPQSVKYLRISRQRNHPWILSTDLHVRQGQAEITACNWDETNKTLTFSATRPQGNSGNVYILAPKGFALADPAGLWIAKDSLEETLVIRCPLNFTLSETIEKTLHFK
ncbi:MAG TPA: hypothetical protein PLN52_06130 [Opitutaceae bacterium]|nr:hypothetical protein [Opitutaceae bacterium]